MKTVMNKKVQIGDKEIPYSDIILTVCRQSPQGGFTIEDVRARMRVIGAVEVAVKNNADIRLEDADHETLNRCLASMRWGAIDKAIVTFNDDIEKG
jgi:hypothetical protein